LVSGIKSKLARSSSQSARALSSLEYCAK
jgi:hypothetical protein